MIDYPTVESLRLDPLPVATMVEAVVGDYLLAPERGIYFRGKLDPVMKEGETYHQYRLIKGVKSVESFIVKEIKELDTKMPVLDLDGNIAVTPNQIPFLTYEPVLPIRGMKIVEAAVLDIIDSYGSRDAQRCLSNPLLTYVNHIALDFIREEALVDQITGIVAGIRAEVRNFCGDNRWLIHFVRRDRMTLFIEKSIDWRIVEYYRLSGLPYGK
jgi:hypothetical protein